MPFQMLIDSLLQLMRRLLIGVVYFLLVVSGLSGTSADASSSSEIAKRSSASSIGNSFNGIVVQGGRSLSSNINGQETALVAALDGTVHLIELKSKGILWSFSSGPSIHSSYQAPLNHDNDKENASESGNNFFIDCGDDWELYMQNKFGKVKLQKSIEEYLSITPHITEDGRVILGSKQTSVFLVDAKTGRFIYNYKSTDSPPTSARNKAKDVLYDTTIKETRDSSSLNLKSDDHPLYITRTDYTLKCLEHLTGNVLWNVTVADVEAAFICEDSENSFGGTPLDSEYAPFGPHTDFQMPLHCQSRAYVYRLRKHNMLETFSRPYMLPEARHEDKMLAVSISSHMIPSQPNIDKLLETMDNDKLLPVPINPLSRQLDSDKFLDSNHESKKNSLDALPSPIGNPEIPDFRNMELPLQDNLRVFHKWYAWLILVVTTILVWRCALVEKKQAAPTTQASSMNKRITQSKRKKRKSGKDSSISEKNDMTTSGNCEDECANTKGDKSMLNFYKSTKDSMDGRIIGKLCVSNREIAKGSNGTIIFEGVYEGRLVAVKRLVKAYHDLASKEIQNLIASDRHPNIVRWYGVEEDHDFVYLALERCGCNLYDLIEMSVDSHVNPKSKEYLASKSVAECNVCFDFVKGIENVKLWKPNGHPSPTLLKLMRDVVSGLVHLHELGIIHRDLKPQNVLIIKERAVSLHAKISDMGISKHLVGNMSSLSHHNTGYGSSGWQAPEQLLLGRQTRAVDMFSLGCVLFFCFTGGRHPFGDPLERDMNITKNKMDLFLVENIPEAVDLFSHLLHPIAERRLKASEVLHHPLFWDSEKRLSFLHDVSDRIELEDRETESELLKAVESVAPLALGTTKWDEKMDSAFIDNIGRYRRYKFDSVRDLLRVMRNKLNHYRELPLEMQELLGPNPEGFDSYFTSRFPKLLIEVYKVMRSFCSEEEFFHKYFQSNVVH